MNWKLFSGKALLVTVMLLQAIVARAQTYTCTGPVLGVTVNPDGLVVAEQVAGIGWAYLCRLGATYNGVTPDACKGIHASLLVAQLTQKDVMLWFNDGATGGSCNTRSVFAPLTGWYFGPRVVN